MFGLDKGKKKRNPKVTQEEKPIDYREVQYIGGLTEYPKSEDIGIYSYNERFSIWFTKRESWLKVPYSHMMHIGNSYQTKVSLGWLIGLGILFLPYLNSIIIKKKHMYTNINYNEGSGDQKFMIDFEKNLEYAQNLIYKRMQEARKRGNVSIST